MTLPEPWLMLNLVYGMQSEGIETEYNAKFASFATKDYLERVGLEEDSFY